MKIIFYTFALLAPFSVQSWAALDCTKPSAKSLAYLQGTPCADVISACNSGGYYLGCEKKDQKGLLAACFNPIVFKGASVSGVTAPADVASCKSYCQQNKGTCK